MDPLSVALLTGGGDKHYALDLSTALTRQGVSIDFIGSDDLDVPELTQLDNVRFLNLRGDQSPDAGVIVKMMRILVYYVRLVAYAATSRPRVFHILWNNKFLWFDRTLLMLYYRLLGKRVVLTAHNINAGRRDENDSVVNRLTLKCQYALASQVFVHTRKMKEELGAEFDVPGEKVTLIPYGMYRAVPDTSLTSAEARAQLGLRPDRRVILFFGNIAPYKGLEYLLDAMGHLEKGPESYQVVVAGRPKGPPAYFEGLQNQMNSPDLASITVQHIKYIADEDIALYFKAADVLALPYRHIYQSGVLFLSYCFGLPALASDVGSLREDVVEGKTGHVFAPEDARDLARAIEQYFDSSLYRELDTRRAWIREYAEEHHSWDKVAVITRDAYARALRGPRLATSDAAV